VGQVLLVIRLKDKMNFPHLINVQRVLDMMINPYYCHLGELAMLRIDSPHSSRKKSHYTPPNIRIADMIVHIDEPLKPEGMREIKEVLSCHKGVGNVVFNPTHPHLAIIHYDSFQTSSKAILKILNSDSLFKCQIQEGGVQGLHVQLVGI
jgi:hypothetical protein